MFSTLESSWDKSARRGWWAIASFSFQAMALSLLLAIPMFWVQGPPRLHWLQPLNAPMTQTPAAPEPVTRQHYTANSVSNILNNQVIAPRYIPHGTPVIDDRDVGPAPDLGSVRFGRTDADAVPYGLGNTIPVVTPKPPAATHPLKISHLAECNLIYRVQPQY